MDLFDIIAGRQGSASGTGGAPQKQANWEQNDNTKVDYIKNRPFYVDEPTVVTLYDKTALTFVIEEASGLRISEIPDVRLSLVDGETYTVNFDDVDYIIQGQMVEGSLCLGNLSIMDGNLSDTGEPFLLIYDEYSENDYSLVICTNILDSTTHTLSLQRYVEHIVKLDNKFLDLSDYAKNEDLSAYAKTEALSDYAKNSDLSAYAKKTDISGKMNSSNPTGSGSFSLNRSVGSQIGAYSVSTGNLTTASGGYSHSEGNNTTASNESSHAEGNNTTASGASSHAEGTMAIASGNSSHAECYSTTASGNSSHAECYSTTALGSASHAEGYNTTASGNYSHAEGNSQSKFSNVVTSTNPTNDDIIAAWKGRKFSVAKGVSSHVEGDSNLALGVASHAEGSITTASGNASHAECYSTTASGNSSHAEGFNTTASGSVSHAEGSYTTASGSASHAEGENTTASGFGSHAEGENTTASGAYQHVQGKYNIDSSDYAHIIGNGQSNNKSNAHTVDWQGNAWYAGAVASNGADYAEFFEWLDGNPNEEDRVGYLVALDGEKIKLANSQDEILGIVSANPAILGDNYECNWKGKYLVDEFGRILYEKVEEFIDIPKLDEETGETVIEKQSLGFFDHPKLNPDYDPNQEYINRRNRPEWAMVGMLGKLLVRDDGTSEVNGYVTAKENGIATASTEKTNIRVLSRVNDHIIKVYLK